MKMESPLTGLDVRVETVQPLSGLLQVAPEHPKSGVKSRLENKYLYREQKATFQQRKTHL